MNDWNKNIIDQFRANAGKVGPPFENTPLLLLHNTGRKSGKEYVNRSHTRHSRTAASPSSAPRAERRRTPSGTSTLWRIRR